jgi:hypothetical protein
MLHAGERAPVRSNPEIAAALDTLGDPAHAYGKHDFPANLAFNACGKGDELMLRYLYWPENGEPGRIAKNQPFYENEIRSIGLFGRRCKARSLEALARAPREELEEARRRHGAVIDPYRRKTDPSAMDWDMRVRPTKEVWRSVALEFAILPILMSSAKSSESYRRELVAAAAAEAATFASALPLGKRAEMLESLTRSRNSAPDWGIADLERVLTALRDTSCAGLCARAADD